MIDTRFETTIDLRGEIENYRQVALIKYYKILLELDPRRDRLTMLAVIRCIDKLERHSQERKRPRNDKKKMLAARLKGYLDGLPPKTRRRIVLAMLAAFAVLALYTFGKAVYEIGRNDGSRMVTDHAGQVELSIKPDNNHNVIPYLYGTDEE